MAGQLIIDFDASCSNGRLNVQADPIAGGGAVTLKDGTFLSENRNGCKPTGGSFTILTYTSITGDFGTDISGDVWTVNNVNYHFRKDKGATTYNLTVITL
jgi:hypothetical protein